MITRAPASLTYDTSAHFEFSDQGKQGSFQCRLDNAPFVPCGPGGTSYQGLDPGQHCFYVLAIQGGYRSAPRGFCWQCRPIRVNGDFTIGANAPHLFYPGTSEPLDLAITNPFKFPIKVLSVSVTVEPVPAKNGAPDPACPAAANLLVTRPLGATLAIPARSTKSLSDLGVPQAQWPVLTMPDLPTNQDACEGATFTLLYSGTATMGTVAGTGNHHTINGGNGNETIYFGTGTYNTYRGTSNRSNTCHVPVPPSSWHGTPAAYYDDTLIGCTVVAS